MTQQDQLATVIATAVGAALAQALGQRNRKAAAKQQKAKVVRDASPEAKAERTASYEASVVKGLNAKGIKSADIQLRVNVLPYKGWLEKGRVVRKGQHGVKGLFHISQTDELPAKPEGAAPTTATVQ